MKKRKISHAGARQKGLNFERAIANALKEIFPNARRHLEFQIAEAKGFDIANTEPFLFQCKKLKAYASVNTIKEIQCQREVGDVPVLVTAGNGEPAMVVLHFEDFLNLLKGAIK